MFYSPTKEFVRFSTYRTAQINALRQRIQKEKVTPDQINTTQLRLQKLRKQYDGLQKQEHCDLKDVLQNSQVAIMDLQRELAVSDKEGSSKKQQLEELQKIKSKLQESGEEEEQKVRIAVSQKEKLFQIFTTNQQYLLQGQAQIDSCSKQLQKQRKIKDDIVAAHAEVGKKWEELRVIEENCQREKNMLSQKINSQKAELHRLQKELQFGEKQVEKHKHLKQNCQISQKFFEEKIQKLQDQKLLAKESQQAEGVQQQIGVCIKSILQNIGSQSLRVQKQELSYQRKIKEVLMRVSEQEQVKCKLQQKVAIARANLRLFKEKNENLKSKMNAIFKNDSQLIKTIASKKVYPHIKGEIVEIVKKSAVQPSESKQNQLLAGGKHLKVEVSPPLEPRLFSQTNRVL